MVGPLEDLEPLRLDRLDDRPKRSYQDRRQLELLHVPVDRYMPHQEVNNLLVYGDVDISSRYLELSLLLGKL